MPKYGYRKVGGFWLRADSPYLLPPPADLPAPPPPLPEEQNQNQGRRRRNRPAAQDEPPPTE